MGTLIPRVSCVSFVSRQSSVNAAETHEAVRWESGMRYQSRHFRPDQSSDRALHLPRRRPGVRVGALIATATPMSQCSSPVTHPTPRCGGEACRCRAPGRGRSGGVTSLAWSRVRPPLLRFDLAAAGDRVASARCNDDRSSVHRCSPSRADCGAGRARRRRPQRCGALGLALRQQQPDPHPVPPTLVVAC